MFFEYLLEILLLFFIIIFLYSSYKNRSNKKQWSQETIASTAKDLNKIKELLIEERASCQEREDNLNQTICNLQENLKRVKRPKKTPKIVKTLEIVKISKILKKMKINEKIIIY